MKIEIEEFDGLLSDARNFADAVRTNPNNAQLKEDVAECITQALATIRYVGCVLDLDADYIDDQSRTLFGELIKIKRSN